MRLKKFIPIAAVAVLSAVGCNPVEEVKPASEVAGTYSGYSTSLFQYVSTPMVSNGQTVTLAEVTDETVSVSYVSDTWGTFTISEATVKESDGVYTVVGEGTSLMGMGGESSEYPCTVTASIISASDFSIVFDIPSVMDGLTITVLPGEAPVGLIVSGTYTGTMDISVMGNSMGKVEDAAITIDATTDDITVTTPTMGSESMTIESMVITGVHMTEADGVYTLTQESINVTAGDMNITGNMTGTVTSEGSASFIFELIPGAMPMAITVTFEGSK